MTYYLDTNICIFALKRTFPSIAQWMEQQSPDRMKIPAIVKAELLLGVKGSDHPKRMAELVGRFLEPFDVVPFDDQCTDVYAAIRWELERAGQMIGPNDLLIAATVVAQRGTLVTHNTKEFGRIQQLSLQDWTQPSGERDT